MLFRPSNICRIGPHVAHERYRERYRERYHELRRYAPISAHIPETVQLSGSSNAGIAGLSCSVAMQLCFSHTEAPADTIVSTSVLHTPGIRGSRAYRHSLYGAL